MTELASRARFAVLWTGGFQIFRDVLQFALMLVLVRLLPSEAYGQFGLTTTILSFLTLYSFRAFLGHSLQVRRDDEANFQGHFTAGVAIQLGMFLLANAVAVGLRWVPTHAAISPLLHVMSVLFILDLPSELRVKMLERRLDWQRLRGLHALGLVASGGLSILLAWRGWGVYALLLPLLIVPLPFAYDLFVRERWRPTWHWEWREYRQAWRFGSTRVFATSFVAVAQLLESALLSGTVGFALYGIYTRTQGLTLLACERTASMVSTSVYPVLTRIDMRTEAYQRASALLLRAIAWTVAPIGVLLGLLAPEVVGVLYGSQWMPVASLLPWALAAGVVVAMIQPAYTLLLAHQRQDRCLAADIWRLVGTILILSVALPFGIPSFLMGLLGVHLVSLTLILTWLRQDGAVSGAGIRAALVPPLVASGCAGAVALGAGLVPVAGEAWRAIFDASVFGAAYLLVLRIGYRRHLEELVGYLPKRHSLSRLLLLPSPA